MSAAHDPRQAEYDRLFSEVDELAETGGVDAPEYQTKLERLQQLERELGIVNDPGIDDEGGGDGT